MSLIDFASPWDYETPEARTERESTKFRSAANSILEDFQRKRDEEERLRREQESARFREAIQPEIENQQAQAAQRDQESVKFRSAANTILDDFMKREGEVESQKFREGAKALMEGGGGSWGDEPQKPRGILEASGVSEEEAKPQPGESMSEYQARLNSRGVSFAPGLTRNEALGRSATLAVTPTIPESALNEIGSVPVAGPSLRNVASFGSSPAGLASLFVAPGVMGAGLAGQAIGGSLGGAAEEAGLPDIPTPLGDISPRTAGEVAGGLATPGMLTAPGKALRSNFSRNPEDLFRGATEVIAPKAGEPLSLYESALKKVNDALSTAKENYAATKAARVGQHAERGTEYRRILEEEIAKGTTPGEADRIASGALKGQYEPIPGIQVDLALEESRALSSKILRSGLRNFEVKNAFTALGRLEKGEGLSDYYINLLGKVYGTEYTTNLRSAMQATSKQPGLGSKLFDVMVLPKAVLSSFDVSYPLRQAAMMAPGHPKEFLSAFAPMFKSYARESTANRIYTDIVNDARTITVNGVEKSLGQVKTEAGLLRSLDSASEAGEEAFRGSLAERLPIIGRGVRASNRAFVTFGNKFRSDTFDTIIGTWQRNGVELTDERVQDLSNLLNRFTGRGTLNQGRLTALMQATWWAPQYRVSGPQAVAQLLMVKKDPLIAKEAARNLVAYFGTGAAIAAAAKYSGLAEVELDPRSSDFGKIRIGNTRINLWGTNQLLARTAAQIITGESFSRSVGGAMPADRLSVATRYFRSGLAPEWSFIADVLRGENYIGEPMSLNPEDLKREAWQRLVPLAIQDIADAAKAAYDDPSIKTIGTAGAVSLLAPLGTGTQTYVTPTERVQQAYDKSAESGSFGPDATLYKDTPTAIRSKRIAEDPNLNKMNLERDTESQKINTTTEQPLIPTANAVSQNLPDAGTTYREQRKTILKERMDRKDQQFKGSNSATREADKLADGYYAIQPEAGPDGFIGPDDMKVFFKAQETYLAQVPADLRDAITKPIRFNDPAVQAAEERYQKTLDTYKVYMGTPKYKGLTPEQGDMVDAMKEAMTYVRVQSGDPENNDTTWAFQQVSKLFPAETAEFVRKNFLPKPKSTFVDGGFGGFGGGFSNSGTGFGVNRKAEKPSVEDPRRDLILSKNPDLAYFRLVSPSTLTMKQRSLLPEWALADRLSSQAREMVGTR